jgi:hypothetical protein
MKGILCFLKRNWKNNVTWVNLNLSFKCFNKKIDFNWKPRKWWDNNCLIIYDQIFSKKMKQTSKRKGRKIKT